jgi:uncharacterized protein (TIGR00251 family)
MIEMVATGRINIEVKLTPRASRDEIKGMRDGVLLVRVTAPPVEGKANEAMRRLIAKRAGVPKSRVSIVRGERGRLKLVAIEGVDESVVKRLR